MVRERGGNGTLRGWPWSLPLAEWVLAVAVYYRTNLTTRQVASLFGISSSTACRMIRRHGPLPALVSVARPGDASDRLWIVDGTLVPVRERHVGSSPRNYRFSVNVQVIVGADTRLVVAAARPVPGTRADAHAWRKSGLAGHCQGVTVLGAWTYLNCGMVVPHRKRPRRALLPGKEADNAARRTVRARVEHVIGRMKNYKMFRDCQQHGGGLYHAVQAVAQMHNLALASGPENRPHVP